jgi:hypothetical protein
MKRQAYGFRDQEFFTLKILAIHETTYELVGSADPWSSSCGARFHRMNHNFCWHVRTLNEPDVGGRNRRRTPAMAAGLADHIWTMHEWVTMPSVQRR